MKVNIQKLQAGNILKFAEPAGSIKRVNGYPYEYNYSNGQYTYRKANSNDQWKVATGEAASAIQSKVYNHPSKTQTTNKTNYNSSEFLSKFNPKSKVSPNSGEIRASTTGDRIRSGVSQMLESVGWRGTPNNPRGPLKGIMETFGYPAIGGITAAYLPAAAAAFSATQLPGNIDYMKYAYNDPSATTGDKIMATGSTALNTIGLVGGSIGAYRQIKAGIPQVYDPSKSILPRQGGASNQQVNAPKLLEQSSRVRPQGTTNVTKGSAGKGKGHTESTQQRNWVHKFSAPSNSRVEARPIFYKPTPWQTPFWAYGPGRPDSVQHTPMREEVLQPQTRTEIKTPNTWGSIEFQRAYRDAKNKNLSEFTFGGKQYITESGTGNPGKRYVVESTKDLKEGPITNSNTAVTSIPDSTSTINYFGPITAKILQGGIKGNPKKVKTKISDLIK